MVSEKGHPNVNNPIAHLRQTYSQGNLNIDILIGGYGGPISHFPKQFYPYPQYYKYFPPPHYNENGQFCKM